MRWIEQDLRHLMALAAGGAMAFALFLLMQSFISMHWQTASVSPPATPIDWVTVRHDTPVQRKHRHLPKPKPVMQPPATGVSPRTPVTTIHRLRLPLDPRSYGPKGEGPVVNPGVPGGQAVPGGGALRVLVRIPPLYPPQAAYQNVTGTVTTCFTVRSDGSVANPHVAGATSAEARRLLGQAAIVSILQWKFIPRTENGHAVAATNVCQNIHFTLDQ